MSLERVKRLLRNTAFRLAFWYTALFIISFLLLHVHEHWLLHSIVRENNRNLVMRKVERYSDIEKNDGFEKLLQEIKNDHLENKGSGFLVRLVDKEGESLWVTLPHEIRDSASAYLEEISLFSPEQWYLLIVGADGEKENRFIKEYRERKDHYGRMFMRSGKDLHVYGRILPSGILLQVGKTTPEWDVFARNLLHNYFEIMLPATILALLGGIFLARRALRPVRDLIATVKQIETGRMDARVPSRGTGGELDELVRLFNGMLERIETLVMGMREALDDVAHDLRTPLSRMKASIEEALQSDENIENLRESLSDCAEELEEITRMLNVLMDISEAETGVMKLAPEQIKLSSFIRDIVEVYRHVAEEKNLEIGISVPEHLDVHADRARIRQVFANLLDNSIKYTSTGRVRIIAQHKANQIAVSFEDTGEGITPEDVPRIFDRLYRCDRSRSRRGLGLGLSFVKAVIEAHNGRVEVQSKLNQGSAFTVFLPADHSG